MIAVLLVLLVLIIHFEPCRLAAAVIMEPGGPLFSSTPFSLGAMLAMSQTLGLSTGAWVAVSVNGCRDRWKGFASCFVASGRRKSGCLVLFMTSSGGGRFRILGPVLQKLERM